MRKNNQSDERNQPQPGQLIPKKGEEYLREVANIEDMPSPEEEKEAEKALKEGPDNEGFRK